MLIEEVVGGPVRGVLTYGDVGQPGLSVVLCGANPFLGGRPDNPTARELARAFASAGALVFAWEYRAWDPAIDADEFESRRRRFWDNGALEHQSEDDLAMAAEAVVQAGALLPGRRVVLAGYSYGGALAIQLGAGSGVPVFAVSPPLRTITPRGEWDLSPCWIVAGTDDLAATAGEIDSFAGCCARPWGGRHILQGADHFHVGSAASLGALAAGWITSLAGGR